MGTSSGVFRAYSFWNFDLLWNFRFSVLSIIRHLTSFSSRGKGWKNEAAPAFVSLDTVCLVNGVCVACLKEFLQSHHLLSCACSHTFPQACTTHCLLCLGLASADFCFVLFLNPLYVLRGWRELSNCCLLLKVFRPRGIKSLKAQVSGFCGTRHCPWGA